MKYRGLKAAIVATVCGVMGGRPATAGDIDISGFGDISFATTSGEAADVEARAEFDENGTDESIKNSLEGANVAGADFVATTDLADFLVFQAEINLQVARGESSEFEVDVERMYLDYMIRPEFNIMAGLYFTPIGYANRNLYARAWLMRSIQVHDFFEEEYGLMPTHSVGLNLHGTLSLPNGHSLMYAVHGGNGRGANPDEAVYARDGNEAKEVTGLLEWRIPSVKELRIGVSGWRDEIETLTFDDFGEDMAGGDYVEYEDLGADVYVYMDSKRWFLFAEYFASTLSDEWGSLGGEDYNTSGFTAEVGLNLRDNTVHPYIRYDVTDLPEEGGGPYYSLRDVDVDSGTGSRVYVPDLEAVMVGVAYDLTTFNRIKAEYIHYVDGPNDEHGYRVQTAFAF